MTGREWIESNFNKKECAKFVSSKRDPRKCGCGRSLAFHRQLTQTSHLRSSANSSLWNSKNHTVSLATDAYGLLEFQGAGHGNKAKYIRLADDTSPDLILHLLKRHWNLGLPNLLISMRGGLQDFAMQPKLKRVLCKGLSKAARTTGAWIMTGGTNTGVTMLMGNALNNHSVKMRGRVVTIGIAPWGVLNSRESLIGQDAVRPYHSVACPVSKGFKLNSHHTHFLLVDNGTVDQYGCEMLVRRKFEKYLSTQHVNARRQVPVVSVVVEGGANVVRTVLANVSGDPPIPVVVFDGTGRAADIIAFMHKYTSENGMLSAPLKEQILETIKHTFDFTHRQSEKLYHELEQCMKKKEMITVFCLGTEGVEDFDLAILTALLKAQTKSYTDQLNMALSWNRVDIAKKQIFIHGRDWPEGVLDQVMMDALTNDKVEFVKLLKDNGVNMHKFLTVARLEELYNTKQGPGNTLAHLVKDVRKHHHQLLKYSLYDMGLVFENLMGGTYQSTYTDRRFKALHQTTLKKGLSFALLMEREVSDATIPPIDRYLQTFPFPFNELFIWAVLTKRHNMALFLWRQDEEALAKALVASSLYRAMAKSAEVMNLEAESSGELRRYAQEFNDLAMDLLDQCYREDEVLTMQLLTVQLDNWSKHTCLSLAAMAQHNKFMAHACCQVLLNDLWHGGMQAQKYINIKVITSLLFPVCIFAIGFKTTEELLLMPQTLEEHMQDVEDADRPSITSSTSFTRLHNIKEEEEIPMSERKGLRQRLTMTSKEIDPIEEPCEKKPTQKRQLSGGKKLYEFFNAPITKFWSYTIFYVVFMFMYNYVCLFRMEAMPSFFEWIVILYIITTGMEHVRELMLAEPTKLAHKFRVFYSVFWNVHDVIAIVTFMTGFILRMVPSTHLSGRVVYCVVIVLWYLRFLEILSVSNYLGPLINMIGKMLRDMCYFLVVLIIILVSFGVIRQSILNPDVDPSWWPVREVLHEPYWMIYGEVYAGKINPPCGDGPDMDPCLTGRWVVPVAMSIYCLVANILIVNMLIALFNTTFQRIMPIANQLWKFQRYHVTMKYEQKPILVPPFTIIYYLYSLFKFVVCQCRKCEKRQKDIRLKLFLDREAMDSVRDFEEACLELYLKDKEIQRQVSSEERLREVAERTEDHSYQLEEIVEKENISKLGMRSFERRLMRVEEASFQTARNIMDIRQLLMNSLLPTESNENLLGVPESRLKSASDSALNHDATPSEKSTKIQRWKAKSGGSYPPMQKPKVHDRGNPVGGSLSRKEGELLRENPEFSIERVSPRTGRRKLVSSKNFDDGSLELKSGGASSKDSSRDSERAMRIDSHSAESSGESDLRPLTPDKEDGLKALGSPTSVPAVILEQGRSDIKRNHCHKVLRLSTFERYLSMVAPQQDIENPRPGPVRRQVGAESGVAKDHGRHLGMRHIDSESNMSVYSNTSVQTPKLGTMQRPMPYTSAPVYSTITDHIDLSSVNANRLHDLGASTSSTGYISMNDNIDNEMPASPSPFVRPGMGLDFTPFTSLSIRSDTLVSPTRPDHLKKVEQGCYDIMDDSESDQDQTRLKTDIEDEEESGIEFAVRKSSDSQTSQESREEEGTRETTF
ncbi:transient receptor potential cation channel subfamily M member 3-like isoform X2 [Lytechinus variegatus]|uniref:transient receptor potential cation channel subfamily M member 3-like isoform X2 n=1 Tax=Lytechinus variegatus TaxID=7654 RepID=UPI001BB16651|nr:transient receptor potential cation channel subfamily M member 3-like isoform X2 [Lytechinus variegatus]